jgi:DNA mismatch endonuclease (patch repair protein)
MDTFTREQRSAVMRQVRGKDTKPELMVRRMLHRLGYRYRLHVRELPGCPDLVFPGRKKVVFINGCYWHGHTCEAAALPASNRAYWKGKQERNAARDKRNTGALRRAGWGVATVWECEIKKAERVQARLVRFLG